MPKVFYFLGDEQFQPEILVQHARLAEKVGFDGILVSEHFHPWVADNSAAGFAFSVLGVIAVTTEKLELMTGVVSPLFRFHPAIVAQAAATIDRISHGRFSLGIGSGESINETPLGFYYPSYVIRAERLEEATQIISGLLKNQTVTFSGRYYQTKNAHLYSPPTHHVPILLAAAGTKTAQLAGRTADGIITSIKDPDETKQTIVTPAQQAARDAKKNSFRIVASRWTVFAQTDDEALHALGPWRGLRAPSRNTATDPRVLQHEADALTKEEILSRYAIVKNAQDYIDAYSPLVTTIHADTIVIQTTGVSQENLIHTLGTAVIPKLKNIA